MTVVFLTSGSTSPWNTPGDWTSSGHTIELVGCGGRCGAMSTGTNGRGGGGGGGGCYVPLTYSSGTIGSSTPFEVNSNSTTTADGTTAATAWQSATFTNCNYAEAGRAGSTTTAGAGGSSTTSVTGTPSPLTYTTGTKRNGGAGGAASTSVIGGGGGGGGAAGPAAAGGTGGGGGTTAAFGGGGGGAGNNASNGASASSASGGAGGTGVGPSHGGGAGATSVTSPNGSAGIGGQGGGAGAGSSATSGTVDGHGYAGGPNGNVSNWVQTSDAATAGAGAGGGGGGGMSGNFGSTISSGGNGANYGGGGGGAGGSRASSTNVLGTGASGIIVITYTAATVVSGSGSASGSGVASAEGITIVGTIGSSTGTGQAAAIGATADLGQFIINEGWSPNPAPILLLHCDANDGITTFIDSGSGHTVTPAGDAQVDTSQSVFGGASVRFGGMTDYLTLDGASDFAIGTGDFTFDCRARFSDYDKYNLIDWNPGPKLCINTDGKLYYLMNGVIKITGTTVLSPNTQYHVAVCRSAGTTKMFLNGVQEGSDYVASDNITVTAGNPDIGTRI